MKHLFLFTVLLLAISFTNAQQLPDTTYHPVITNPAYELGQGPIVLIDEGHHNFHTKDNRYKAFANLLESDGYVVEGYEGAFTRENLSNGKILVISNAMHASTLGNWIVPTTSAFTPEEIDVVADWVKGGGSLFLIADHMPMGGAAAQLADAFGFSFTNGFAFDTTKQGPAEFSIEASTLIENTITKGRDDSERIDKVLTFTGQAFEIPDDAEPILTFNDHFINLLPDTAWRFHDYTETYIVGGWSQGAYKKFGQGKVVAFGEAAMFSSQLAGPNHVPVGMSSEGAEKNHQLLLNLVHWLDGLLEE